MPGPPRSSIGISSDSSVEFSFPLAPQPRDEPTRFKPLILAAAERADDASGRAREWKAWRTIHRRWADKQTEALWIRKARGHRCTRRNTRSEEHTSELQSRFDHVCP